MVSIPPASEWRVWRPGDPTPSRNLGVEGPQHLNHIDANFFHRIAPLLNKERRQSEPRDGLTHSCKIIVVEQKVGDGIAPERIHTEGHDQKVGLISLDVTMCRA